MFRGQTKKRFLLLLIGPAFLLVMLACGGASVSSEVPKVRTLPALTPTPATKKTDGAQSFEMPTPTPIKLNIIKPSNTPEPAATTVPTSTPGPTATSLPTVTPQPTIMPTLTSTPIPTPSVPPTITLLAPRPEDCRLGGECILTMGGTWVGVDTRGPLRLYVLVRPVPDDPNQSYWVQAQPVVDDTGGWSLSPMRVGQPGDQSGLPFKLCVVATTEALNEGQPLGEPPSGLISCLNITRGVVATATSPPPSPTPPLPPSATPSPTPTPPPPLPTPSCQSTRPLLDGPAVSVEVEITSPKHCDRGLPETITVGGAYSGDLTGREIWVLVYPTDLEYYPQTIDACKQIPSDAVDGKWNTVVNFGGPPQQYDVVVAVIATDGEASQEFKQWLQRGCETHDFPGYLRDDLPDGLTEVAAITVSKAGQ